MSAPITTPELPHTWRPFGVRMAGYVFGGLLLVFCIAFWILIGPTDRAKFTTFQMITLVAMGLLAFSVWWALVRPRVTASAEGLTVVNGYKRRDLEWAQVIGVNLRRGAPWASLDLSDGETVAVMAIQGSDGPRAARAVRELRALIAAQTDA